MTIASKIGRSASLLERLVAFDTTSRESNLALIAFVEDYLGRAGIATRRLPSEDGRKANLIATVGPPRKGGLVLSGHTDVVPVDGQDWSSDPFRVTVDGDRLIGRGTADMKAFIACALAALPGFEQRDLAHPIHLALSYDEEIGCLGAHALAAAVARDCFEPALAIIGEPTMMRLVEGQKGAALYEVVVRGVAGHSSAPEQGLSAIMHAIPLLAHLHDLAARLREEREQADEFEPPYSTLTVGRVDGGTSPNILAAECRFTFDLRCLPDETPAQILAPFLAEAEDADRRMRAFAAEAGIAVSRLADVPPLAPEARGAAANLVRRITGDNGGGRCVAYGSEAGIFQRHGLSAVICGPGSIEQAHTPDEYITIDQLRRCDAFMAALPGALGA